MLVPAVMDLVAQLAIQEGDAPLWKRLHRGHYSPDNKYFVHWFSRVVGEIR